MSSYEYLFIHSWIYSKKITEGMLCTRPELNDDTDTHTHKRNPCSHGVFILRGGDNQ